MRSLTENWATTIHILIVELSCEPIAHWLKCTCHILMGLSTIKLTNDGWRLKIKEPETCFYSQFLLLCQNSGHMLPMMQLNKQHFCHSEHLWCYKQLIWALTFFFFTFYRLNKQQMKWHLVDWSKALLLFLATNHYISNLLMTHGHSAWMRLNESPQTGVCTGGAGEGLEKVRVLELCHKRWLLLFSRDSASETENRWPRAGGSWKAGLCVPSVLCLFTLEGCQ